ncbi:MAG TPA: homoserine kinase [Nitrososphaeraceae archaeon]|nr:homoserine kinase [Nitrososphaeraceae archaeon]
MIEKSESEPSSCTAIAPCSTANLGPGYDVFGLGLDAFEDIVMITKMSNRSKQITIQMSGQNVNTIPLEVEANTAGIVIKNMAKDFDVDYDLRVNILKRVPAGFGIGSSAASAVAAAVAFDRLFDLNTEKKNLIEYSAEGEAASAGAKHYDNVSGSLLGGFVIVRTSPELELIRIDPPPDLVVVIAIPIITVPQKKTQVARDVLPKEVALESVIHNVSNASTIVAGFLLKDIDMIAKGIDDIIVEPARKHLIQGYDAVRRNALETGALAVTISGAGPSMISFLNTDTNSEKVANAMTAGFKEAKIKSRTFICRPSNGAKVVAIK